MTTAMAADPALTPEARTNANGPTLPARIVGGRPFVCAAATAGILVSVLAGTTTTMPLAPGANVRWLANGGGTGSVLNNSGRVPLLTPDRAEVPPDAATASTVTEADQVRWLHTATGLTWDQLGRVFGVSRRSVHLWANGGRMNASNATRLAEFVAMVRELPARDPGDARARLLAAGPDGHSLLDMLRDRNTNNDINGSPFTPAQLLDARHDAGDLAAR